MTERGDPPSKSFSGIERHAALERAPKSRAEIEQLLLRELRTTEGCEGAKGIAVIGYDDVDEEGPNWTIAAFNAGSASGYMCERALMTIVARFQRFYELVQKH
jgi:hypothetical protein